jgi:hypothetical protein
MAGRVLRLAVAVLALAGAARAPQLQPPPQLPPPQEPPHQLPLHQPSPPPPQSHQPPPPPAAAIAYVVEAPAPKADALRARFIPGQLAILELLNRADIRHLPALPALVVPAAWYDDALLYSPFPMRSDGWLGERPKHLVVDQAFQAFAAYESGRLVRWGPINSGRLASQTPAGLFHLNWRSRGRHSTVDPEWFLPWYFNFHNTRGLSFHQYALPGHPASHSCLRLLERDARWLHDWGEVWALDDRGWVVLEQGTPVLILNCYAFGQPPPWRSPDRLRAGVRLPAVPELSVRECGTDPQP